MVLTGDEDGVALATGHLLDWYVVTTEPRHCVHLLALGESLP